MQTKTRSKLKNIDPTELPDHPEELKSLIALLVQENLRLGQQLELLANRLFRPKSERIDPDQLHLFTIADEEPPAEPVQEEEEAEEETKKRKRRKKRGHGRACFPACLTRIHTYCELPVERQLCPDCGKHLVVVGEEVSERGMFIPAQIQVNVIHRTKYACPDGDTLITAPPPPALVEKAKYEASMYVHVAVSKYADHLPLHRQEQIFKRQGLSLPRQTMWEMILRLNEIVAKPIVEQMRLEARGSPLLYSDDTPIKVRLSVRGGSRKGYVYAYVDSRYGEPEKILFDFSMTHEHHVPARFLTGFSGLLVADGSGVYDPAEQQHALIRAGCWAHARRKLKEALDLGMSAAARIFPQVQRLFWIESAIYERARSKDPVLSAEAFHELRRDVRTRRSQRVIDKIKRLRDELIASRSVTPKSQLGIALTYMRNQWSRLIVFLEHSEIDIHNNVSERALRSIAVGRNNWMIFGSPRGGEVAAELFSLICSCKALDINPQSYLEDVALRVDTTPASEIARLTPWAWAEEQKQNGEAESPVATTESVPS